MEVRQAVPPSGGEDGASARRPVAGMAILVLSAACIPALSGGDDDPPPLPEGAVPDGSADEAARLESLPLTVTFAPAANTFVDTLEVSLATPVPEATILYTLDDQVPTALSPSYTG